MNSTGTVAVQGAAVEAGNTVGLRSARAGADRAGADDTVCVGARWGRCSTAAAELVGTSGSRPMRVRPRPAAAALAVLVLSLDAAAGKKGHTVRRRRQGPLGVAASSV